MIRIDLESETDFNGWRNAARALCGAGVSVSDVCWCPPGCEAPLFAEVPNEVIGGGPKHAVRATKAFLDLARKVVCHTDPQRFARLYAVLMKLQVKSDTLSNRLDDDVAWLLKAEKSIRRDVHKMHAFVRFRKAGEDLNGREHYAAWFEPTYRITEIATPFFKRRFPNMSWVIVTPHASATWAGKSLVFGPAGKKTDVPQDDAIEEQWKTYFQSIFNPARLKVDAMTSEMPRKYWANLPEASLIPGMIASAQARTRKMQQDAVSEPNPLSEKLSARLRNTGLASKNLHSLDDARASIGNCTRCPLYAQASQAVFGEGPPDARMMIVGEQPGDQEDIAGRPFVGPAGKVLDGALLEAGIHRPTVYLTNAVKHFKFMPRGKRRMHAKPNAGEIDHCRWWLDFEREQINPDVTVMLGATAVRGVLGETMRLSDIRGRVIDLGDRGTGIVTIHPSYLLRLPDSVQRNDEKEKFVEELKLAATLLG